MAPSMTPLMSGRPGKPGGLGGIGNCAKAADANRLREHIRLETCKKIDLKFMEIFSLSKLTPQPANPLTGMNSDHSSIALLYLCLPAHQPDSVQRGKACPLAFFPTQNCYFFHSDLRPFDVGWLVLLPLTEIFGEF